MQFERSFLGMKVTPLGSMPASPMHPSFLLVNNQPHITHYSYMKGLSFCPEGIILSQSIMPQLDKFTYFTQFFWSCLFLFLLSIFFHYFFPLGIQVRLFCFYLTRPKLQRALSIMKWFIFFCFLVSLVYRISTFFDLIFLCAPYLPFRPVDPTRKLLT